MTQLSDPLPVTADPTLTAWAAEAKLEDGKEHAAQAVRDLKDAASLKAREMKDVTVQRAHEVKRRVESAVHRKTRDQPVGSLLCAFGAGFVLGLILRR